MRGVYGWKRNVEGLNFKSDFFTCGMSNLFDNLCMDSKYTIYYLVFKFFVIRKINIFLVFVY